VPWVALEAWIILARMQIRARIVVQIIFARMNHSLLIISPAISYSLNSNSVFCAQQHLLDNL
jgi:hypothetical protein